MKRKGNYGHKLDDATRKRISESVKKRWKDKEYRDKVSNAHKHELPEDWKKNISKGMTGMQRSEETKVKISKAVSERWKDGILSVTSYDTSIELKVQNQLDEMGIKYIKQKVVHDSKRCYILDFYIPALKLVIECNGDYWHNRPDRIERDNMLKKYVESTGRNIIFIWEHEINDDWFWIGDYLGGDAI